MTFKFPIFRAAALTLAGTMLVAAAQFPAAPVAAFRSVETPAPTLSAPVADNDTPGDAVAAAAAEIPSSRPAELATLVADTIDAGTTAYGERECLARAVYFEARGEPLAGQLAVAQVILNRVASGRYAGTVCGVIAQPGQFSFNHARTPAGGHDWQVAKAIAAIAATAAWDVVAPQATAFHATRVNVSWSMHKVGTIGNHVFYR
jgi:hypothetical protein